jgi:hypothetical protein
MDLVWNPEERENSGSIGDFASTIQILKRWQLRQYMYDNYYSIGTDDDPILEEGKKNKS